VLVRCRSKIAQMFLGRQHVDKRAGTFAAVRSQPTTDNRFDLRRRLDHQFSSSPY
jgi:hypothetical protein